MILIRRPIKFGTICLAGCWLKAEQKRKRLHFIHACIMPTCFRTSFLNTGRMASLIILVLTTVRYMMVICILTMVFGILSELNFPLILLYILRWKDNMYRHC